MIYNYIKYFTCLYSVSFRHMRQLIRQELDLSSINGDFVMNYLSHRNMKLLQDQKSEQDSLKHRLSDHLQIGAFLLTAVLKTTNTRKNVKIISKINILRSETPGAGKLEPKFTLEPIGNKKA